MQYKYHTKIDDLIERTLTNMKLGLIGKLISVLESVLAKLTRYDEGSVIGSILSFTVRNDDKQFFLEIQWKPLNVIIRLMISFKKPIPIEPNSCLKNPFSVIKCNEQFGYCFQFFILSIKIFIFQLLICRNMWLICISWLRCLNFFII